MFNNIIYFIIVLFIYYFAYPSKPAENSLYYTLTMLLVTWLVFAGCSRWVFQRVLDRFKEDTAEHGRLVREYQGLTFRLSILAIFLFALDVNFFYLRHWIQVVPGLRYFTVLQGVIALTLFFVYLGTIWYFSHPVYTVVFGTKVSRRSFITSNLRLNIPILFPWLVLAMSHDLMTFTPWGGPDSFLNKPKGQFLFFAILITFLMIFLPQLIQYWWGCRPFKPSDKVKEVKRFLREKGLKYRELMRWPIFEGKMMTAGIMGIIPRFRYILITDALMEVLSLEELKAVVAHEMGHAKYRHLLFYIFFFLGFMVLVLGLFNLEDPGLYILFLEYLLITFSKTLSGHTFLVMYGLSILAIILVYFRFVVGFFMRNFERQADLFSAAAMGSPRPTISSLEKIALLSGKSRELPSWHHFSIKERVDYLWRTLSEPRLAKKHHRFVATSFLIYLVFLASFGYLLNFSSVEQDLGNRIKTTAVKKQLAKDPNNVKFLLALAGAYNEMGKLDEAVKIYEKIILLDHSEAVALNNLAWILVTASDETLKDRERGLILAKKAADLNRAPFILDTLAEAYYANGLSQEAITTSQEAISLAKENMGYYKNQLEKFMGRREDR
ncbi:MAG: M48 family metalloprotease [Deltaproteobacteria bacterium]|nr:MAG: M48 family metalloprotease [Deltaproteobacteria bacterium]